MATTIRSALPTSLRPLTIASVGLYMFILFSIRLVSRVPISVLVGAGLLVLLLYVVL